MPFQIIRNDITKVKADAIVNTANPHPIIGSGMDSAIHEAAGPELLSVRKKIGDIPAGSAVSTPAFNLPAKYVIHTVGPSWVDGKHGEEAVLRRAYDAALNLTDQLGCSSVAFPLMAAGSYGFPRDLALSIAISAFTDFLMDHDMTVYLVLFNGKAFSLASSLFSDLRSYIDDNYVEEQTQKEYADMGEIWFLKEPIDISEFKKYVTVSNRGAITPVYGEEYAGLKSLIIEKNQNPPEYFISSVAADAESSRINRYNWLRISYEFRHSFIYEKQFRIYYVDYFLSTLGDIKTIYSECRCEKQGVTYSSRMDNVIRFYRRYLPVEVKLMVLPDSIVTQVTKYCNDDVVYLDAAEKREVSGDRFYNNHVLLIDVDNIFLYDDRTGSVDKICDLDDIRTEDDIKSFREKLAEMLLGEYPELEERRWKTNDCKVYRNN